MDHKIFQSFVRVSLILALSFTGTGSALAAAGDLDPTIGTDGTLPQRKKLKRYHASVL
jgi:hypothetical protein